MPEPPRPHQQTNTILVGTASWSDPGFISRWYPRQLRPDERLAWYAQHFQLVEVNSTFYSVPDTRTVERWCAQTPDGFTFDVKLHQLFSFHSTTAKLLPPELQREAQVDDRGRVKRTPLLQKKLLRIFLGTMSILRREQKLGVLLLQLSPAFSPRKHDLSELDDLLAQLADYPVAVELRNRGWVRGEQLRSTIDFLTQSNAIFVNVDAPSVEHFTILPPDLNELTNPQFAYLRLHGRNAEAYLKGKTVAQRFDYDYNDSEIQEIASRARNLAADGRRAHIIFNNNNLDYAPRAAARLRIALGHMAASPPRPQTLELF